MRSGQLSVAVLGGGVGGLTTAHELAERGFDVTVYEANDRLGGKASSFRYEPDGSSVSLPGEHGFRYVPGFYRNLRNTLSRIPLRNGGTVADNLVTTRETLVASVSSNESVKKTRTPNTIDEWMAAIKPSVGDDELGPAEVNHFQRRLLAFLTSGRLRRERELEYVTLWDYIDADAQSRAYRKYLAEVTQALVAMDPRIASARAILRIHVQLVLDQLMPGRPTESVFNGPTSEVWIEPWVAYLRSQGVQFRTNTRVTALESDGETVRNVTVDGPDGPSSETADYYVAAAPVETMAGLLTPALERAAPSLAGVKHLDTAWMNGIQFFLTEDVPLTRGHQAYVDSAWALTSVSQRQFWDSGSFDLDACSDGSVRGILSVNISDWETPGVVYDRPARECTPKEIKTEVWTQLTDHLNRDKERLIDDVVYDWVLDPAIVYDDATGRLTNRSPLLINTVGSLRHRPSADTAAPNLVLAADYVRTDTDLATMESANEAARHAVRAILRRSSRGALPEVWGLDEPCIFDSLKRLDDIAYAMGAPHPSELERGVRATLRSAMWGPNRR